MERANSNELETLRLTLRKEMNVLADRMAEGGCTSFENYRELVGMVNGLAFAERALLDLDGDLSRDFEN